MQQVLSAAKRLHCPELGTLELSFANGYEVTAFDLGSPTVRTITSPRINASGEDDRTVLTGARVVTMTVACWASEGGGITRRQAVERLRAYANPRYRPTLVFSEDDGVDRRVVLRGDPPRWPFTPEGASLPVTLSFEAPSGLLEDAEATTVTVPAALGAQPGLTYARTYPRRYPATSITGARDVPAGPVWGVAVDHRTQLWGPCTGPRLVNVTTGGVLALPGLTLSADQYVEVDTSGATLRLNGRPAESLYAWQQWGVSSFWRLAPGSNAVRYSPDAFGGDARAVLTYRPATL